MGWGKRIDYRKVEPVSFCGRSFASKLEAAVYAYLASLEREGKLSQIRCQHHVYLTEARIGMIPDFSALEAGRLVFFEAKGFETEIYRLKRRLWKVYGPGPLRIYKGSATRFRLYEEIIPTGESKSGEL